MQNDNLVTCSVCRTGTIAPTTIIDTPPMFIPTGVGVLPKNIALPHGVHIFKCTNPDCLALFHDSLGDHPIVEQSST